MFTALLAHLYISLVQKVSCYLENAFHPPILNETEESQTIFIRLAYVCAFSYSSPNHYVRYPISEIRTDALVIEDMSYPYYELMELGICPKQDYLLIVSVLLCTITILKNLHNSADKVKQCFYLSEQFLCRGFWQPRQY